MAWKFPVKHLLFVLVVLYLRTLIKNQERDDLIVNLSYGQLRGKDNGYYYSYESIPYAKAPLGDLRFEAPQAYEEKWTEVFDATKKPDVCMQWNQLNENENKLDGSEDCLLLNVYKPKTDKEEKYPVVVYIHGGAFMFGSSLLFGEDLIMKNGQVILVNIGYRLGPLGFLSTEDEVVSGNYGLKDQQMALKWIKANIEQFGGDAEKILIIGFSAGAASAHLHMLQPPQHNIAKAMISFSGTALNPWALIKNARQRAIKLAQHLKCPNIESTKAIKQCLKQKKAADIVTSVKEFLNYGYNPFTTFGPVIEHKNAPNAFMTQHPREIIKSSNFTHLPWLAAYTAQDGGYNAAELLQVDPETGKPYIDTLSDKWMELAPRNLFLDNFHHDPVQHAKDLREKYMGELNISEENYLKVQEIYTDVLFKNGIHEALRLHSEYGKAPVYAYVYDSPPKVGLAQALSHRNDMEFGTVHSDDFCMMLSFPVRPIAADEEVTSQRFINMLGNFAAKGELAFGDCKFMNNVGSSKKKLNLLWITKEKCENIVQ